MTAIDNLPARMAELIASHEWDDFPRSAHNQHNYYGACAVCQRDIPRMAEVALGVRDELVAHLSARTAEAEARVGHAEAGAQLSSERLGRARLELDSLQEERAHLKIKLAESEDARREAEAELAVVKRNWQALSESLASARKEIAGRKDYGEEIQAERDALRIAIAAGKIPGFAADVLALVDDYSNKEQSVIARLPFLATFDQICFEKYGFIAGPGDALSAPAEGTTTPARETA